MAEELGMVEADVGDDRQYGCNDVCAVESASQSHLDDGHVDLLLLEVEERHGGGQFEKRGVEGLEEGAIVGHEVDNAFLADHLPVNPYAFTEIYKVWRGVKSHLVTCGLENGCQGV